jgi:hypothetical protein
VLLGTTYERPENVVAWHQHSTDGLYLSAAPLPNASGDELWCAVERELPIADGAFQTDAFQAGAFQTQGDAVERRRYIEVFDGTLNTDAALVYSGDATDQFHVPHLEGKGVAVVFSDGAFQMDFVQENMVQAEVLGFERVTVVDGVATTSVSHTNAEVGLPFVSQLRTLRPELQLASGSLQGRRQHFNEVTVRFLCTSGHPTINGEALRLPEEAEGAGPYTGDVRINERGWDRRGQIAIEQVDPLPCTVLAIGGSIEVDDG